MSGVAPVRVQALRTAFGDHVVHDDLSLEVRGGEILGIVGGSGTGKSVLLDTILGLRRPQAGTVEVLGHDLADQTGQDEVKRRVGVMFQGGALFSSLTVQQNVEAPLVEHTDLSPDFIGEIGRLRLKMAGLPDDAGGRYPSELSGGMNKRAGVARAIALDPELLFLDEPTAGLDPIAADEFDKLVLQLHEAIGLTVVIITHDLDTLYAICDRVAVLADRKVVATAPIAELEKSDHPWIKSYFGGPRGRAAAASGKAT